MPFHIHFPKDGNLILEFLIVFTIVFSLTQFLYFLFLSIREDNANTSN